MPTKAELFADVCRVMNDDARKLREIIAILENVHANDGIEKVFHEIGRAIGTAKVALWNHPKEEDHAA